MPSHCDKMSQIKLDDSDTRHVLKLIVPGGDGNLQRVGGGCIYDEQDHMPCGFATHFQGTEVSDF